MDGGRRTPGGAPSGTGEAPVLPPKKMFMEELRPRLRTVEKYEPLYRLNQFPPGFAQALGREIVYLLMVRRTARLEGTDWEEIFARLVGATWKPSAVGLDDIVFEQCAWGAKTV